MVRWHSIRLQGPESQDTGGIAPGGDEDHVRREDVRRGRMRRWGIGQIPRPEQTRCWGIQEPELT